MTLTDTEVFSTIAQSDGRSPRRGSSQRSAVIVALLLLPGLLFAISLFWPLATVVLRSLSGSGSLDLSDFSLANYAGVFTDEVLRRVTLRTFGLAALSTAITVALGFPVAYLMARLPRRASVALLILIMIPFWVSILVRLFAFTAILGRRGVVNSFFEGFGLGPYDLLFNSPAVVIGMVAYLVPYMVLILYAGMVGIDPSLMTVARTMGASGRQAFLQVYLPQIRAALLSATLLVFVLGLGFFLTPAILGGPQDLTIPVFIQQEIGVYRWGPASAAGIVLLVVSLAGYLLALRLGGTSILAPGGRPAGRGTVAREPLRLTVGTAVSWIITVAVLLLLLLPLMIIVPAAFGETSQIAFPPQGFTTDWFVQVFTSRSWTDSIAKSFRVGIGTAVLATVVGLILARVYSQLRSAWSRTVIQAVAFAPLVVPVILLSIGIFDVQVRIGLVGTDVGLVIAHAIICVPLTFLVISNSMANLDSSLEEAAWSMGVGRVRTFWTIVVPSITPGLVGSAVISFMTSWDEAVLALFQTGLQKTLPVTIYALVRSGVTPAVAAVSVFLIAIVLIGGVVFFLVSLRRSKKKVSA
tara:strand:+ start:18476 stop:20221 length:1746 start_codon:yes stop_codon:yes gene_type:complete